MTQRNLELTKRIEQVREIRQIITPMHFSPKEIISHFDESLTNIEEQYLIADELLNTGNEIACQIIWRSQVVLSEGLLDFYLHEISKYCLFQMFCGNWQKTEKFSNLMIPITKVEEALNTRESNEWFFDYLNIRFNKDVFLSAESMREQLNLIGVKFIDVVCNIFPDKTQKEANKLGVQMIKALFDRRNKIAHQNDRRHEDAKQSNITKEFVQEYISKIKILVNTIQFIVESKNHSSIEK